MPNLSGALKPSGHQLKKKKKQKTKVEIAKVNAVQLHCAHNAQIRLHCCDNKLSVIETADKFKMC